MKLRYIAAAILVSASVSAVSAQSSISSGSSAASESSAALDDRGVLVSGNATIAARINDSGTIRQIQQELGRQGHPVPVDGVLGARTRAALQNYQRDRGFDATGNLDQRTLAALGIRATGEASLSGRQSGSVGSNPNSGGASPSRIGVPSGLGPPRDMGIPSDIVDTPSGMGVPNEMLSPGL